MGEGTTKENNNAEFNAYHTSTAEEAAEFIGTSLTEGLTQDEFVHRLKTVGENTLGDDTKIDYKAMVLHQVCNAMIMVLLISMIISFAMHDWITGGVISFVIAVNVLIGLVQEYKATKTMNSLKNLSSPNAHVIRNGKSETINSKDVVPGDICSVKVGDTIPADLRLIETKNFDTDESLSTGESLPVSKDANLVFGKEEETSVGDRLNLAFSSSAVVKGRAKGIVIKTALNSEIGKIAKSLQGDSGLISRDPSKSWLQNTWISTKKVTGAFLGTNVGTPSHRKSSKLAVLLFWIAVLFAIIVMASQKFDVDKRVAIYAICVALSMIPSSLVVVLTITMSVGAAVMVSRNVIVRKLDSSEALGAVNDICSDKTGTLTQGKMLARQIWIPRFGTITISNSDDPFNPNEGNVSLIPRFSPYEYSHNEDGDVGILQNFKDRLYEKDLPEDIDMDLFQKWLETATLANIATVFKDDATDCWKAHGDPTEIAIQVFATKMDLPHNALTGEKSTNQSNENDQSSLSQHNEKPGSAQFEHIAEFPFDSTVKRMSSVYYNNHNETYNIYGKGAFESIISCCSSWYGKDGVKITPLTDCDVETIRKNVYSLSNEGLRVLGFASKSFTKDQVNDDQLKNITSNRATAESDLVFLGLIGIYDPPRNETAGAVKKFHQAGINVHMLTGDFVGTAKAIAQEVGILPTNLYHYSQEIVDSMVMTGSQFDGLSEEEVDDLPVLPLVIARCSPQTKVRMIEALHRRKKFCTMTGDGVNDSPSLKMANVGIAMGINGSDVSKEASDIVLSDDNFASILNAVEEGRRMTDNIQKFVLQLLAENVAQALYLIIGLVFRDENGKSVFPLSPVEVLWIIVVTSCFPAMGLGLEKAAPDLMDRPPHDSEVGIFTWEVIIDTFAYGIIMTGSCMASFTGSSYGINSGRLGHDCDGTYNSSCRDVYRSRSAAFATMTWCALISAWEVVDMRRSFFRMHPDTDSPVKEFFRSIWGNQFLFWSIIFGFVSAFPVVYIPVINDKVFLHKPIGAEWGLAIAFTIAFWIGAELYKCGKRRYFKTQRAHNPENDLESNNKRDPFEAYSTSTTIHTEVNIGIKQ